MSYNSVPDHPAIQNMERTGYPDGNAPEYPICPECGRQCEKVFFDPLGICAGCDVCLTAKDAWEVPECFPGKEQ